MRERLASARRLCFDTNALIYLLNQTPRYFAVVEEAFRPVRDGFQEAIVSTVTELEMLVLPSRSGNRDEMERVGALLDAPMIRVVAVDRRVARLAADIRGDYRLSLADAAIVATGIYTECDVILGNDARCARRVKEIPYLLLDDLVGAA